MAASPRLALYPHLRDPVGVVEPPPLAWRGGERGVGLRVQLAGLEVEGLCGCVELREVNAVAAMEAVEVLAGRHA